MVTLLCPPPNGTLLEQNFANYKPIKKIIPKFVKLGLAYLGLVASTLNYNLNMVDVSRPAALNGDGMEVAEVGHFAFNFH